MAHNIEETKDINHSFVHIHKSTEIINSTTNRSNYNPSTFYTDQTGGDGPGRDL